MLNRKIPFSLSVAVVILLSLILSVIVINGAESLSQGKTVIEMSPLAPKPIVIISPFREQVINSPLNITGYVNGKEWAAYEGQAGNIELMDSQGKIIATGILIAKTEWTKFPVYFEAEIKYNTPIGEKGVLIFHNENPSGLIEKNRRIEIPVIFGNYLSETIEVQVYFSNNKLDPDINCEKVFPVKRQIERTESVARAALIELLRGPQKEETADGYNTNINVNTELNSIIIDKGTAKADFDAMLEKGVAGSCRVTAIISQITETLKQFSSVTKIIISINGKTKGILQP